jgi:hypothetical protein
MFTHLKTKFAAVLLLLAVCTSLTFASPPVAPFGTTVFDETSGTLLTLDSNLKVQASVVVLGYSQSTRLYGYKSAFILANLAVTTPAAATFTCATSDICTAAASGFKLGLKGQGTTTTTLPAGLSTSTDYFVIPITANTFYLATSYANAVAGTHIDITDTGTGTHTFTPTSIAGGTASLQGSIDGTTFVDITSSSQNVTATTKLYWNVSDTFYPIVRLKFVNTAGVFTSTTTYAAKF